MCVWAWIKWWNSPTYLHDVYTLWWQTHAYFNDSVFSDCLKGRSTQYFALYISPIFHIVEKRIKISLLPFLFPFICQQWPPWVKWCCPPALKQSRCKRTCGTMLCSQCSTRVGLPKGEPTFWGMMMDKGREAYIQLVITVLLSYSVFPNNAVISVLMTG